MLFSDCCIFIFYFFSSSGDKLETAKNIGLACNLIDPDMIPSFASADVDQVVQEFQRTRLIEITGAWAGLAQSTEALNRIFDTFDKVNPWNTLRSVSSTLLYAVYVIPGC